MLLRGGSDAVILVAVISSFFDVIERKRKKYMESETLYFFMFSLS